MNQKPGFHPCFSLLPLETEKKRVGMKMVELLLTRSEVFFEVLGVL